MSFQRREHESPCLTRPGLSDTNHVHAFADEGDRLFLNRSGRLPAQFLDRFTQGAVFYEFLKLHSFCSSLLCSCCQLASHTEKRHRGGSRIPSQDDRKASPQAVCKTTSGRTRGRD